jgi:carboxymethylenebutenolidase
MKSVTSLAIILFLPFSSFCSADPVKDRLEKSPRHHEWVDVETSDGRTVKCWVVFPETDKPVPAVVVIHENRGLNDWARSVTDQVAEAGYVAIAPDLLSGSGPDKGNTDSFKSEDDARTAIGRLKPEQVTNDLKAVVEHARKIESANGKVAVAGFCWGGGQAFRHACSGDDIAAAFVFYGPAPDDKILDNAKAPVYGFYGGNDFRINSQIPRVKTYMLETGKTYEPVTYAGAGHGFMRSGEMEDASDADKKGREEAWKRWKELLAKL